MFSKQALINSLKNNQLENKTILLHSAYGSFCDLEGGPDTLIDSFLALGCTLIVPTFTYENDAYPPLNGEKYQQNGIDLSIYQDALEGLTGTFIQGNKKISHLMGVIPKLILQRENAVRGKHPVNSFSAIGPKAQSLIKEQTYLSVYGPYQACLEDTDSLLLLMGTDFSATTPIHFAEQLAGRRLFRAWANVAEHSDAAAQVIEVAIGSCSDGFNALAPYVEHLNHRIEVAGSPWQIFSFKPFITQLSQFIHANPEITQCNNKSCVRCRDAILGGPIFK